MLIIDISQCALPILPIILPMGKQKLAAFATHPSKNNPPDI
jgi:hypothetical protein